MRISRVSNVFPGVDTLSCLRTLCQLYHGSDISSQKKRSETVSFRLSDGTTAWSTFRRSWTYMILVISSPSIYQQQVHTEQSASPSNGVIHALLPQTSTHATKLVTHLFLPAPFRRRFHPKPSEKIQRRTSTRGLATLILDSAATIMTSVIVVS